MKYTKEHITEGLIFMPNGSSAKYIITVVLSKRGYVHFKNVQGGNVFDDGNRWTAEMLLDKFNNGNWNVVSLGNTNKENYEVY